MRTVLSLYAVIWSISTLGQAESKKSAFINSPPRRQTSIQNFFVREGRFFPTDLFKSQDKRSKREIQRYNQWSRLGLASILSPADSATHNVTFRLNPSISEIPEDSWDACLDEHSSPFLQHAWIRCLEESSCASPETGWVPQHISILIDGKVKGFVPLYLKAHSMGEFIFDNAWADAAYQNDINYYPKLLVGIPFTPATGRRILFHPELLESCSREELADLRRNVGEFLKQLAFSNKISSVHINFLTDEEASDLSSALEEPSEHEQIGSSIKNSIRAFLSNLSKKDRYLRRTSLQYHWTNSNANNGGKPYTTFQDYLDCFKSKRRITIRRERKRVQQDEGIRVDAVMGEEILKHKGLVKRMFEIYLSTVEKMYFGRQYLTLEFFELLCESSFVKNLCFMCARLNSTGKDFKAKDVFAGTINIVKDGVFYGRYWGCLAGKEAKNLHFEVCYWKAIEYCIQNGLKRMEPGAGGGDYKWARGFDPELIHSVHYICNKSLQRAISQFLDFETESNVELTEYLRQRSVIGKKRAPAAT